MEALVTAAADDEVSPQNLTQSTPDNRQLVLQPRLIRQRDAPDYLGMDRNKFNEMVRPYLTEIPLGSQAIAFERVEIDRWTDEYVRRNGRRPKASPLEDDLCQNVTVCRGSASKAASGKSKNAVNTPRAAGSVKAREKLAELRRKQS